LPIEPGDRQEAQRIGRRGGRPRKLRLPEVEAQLGALDTLEDAGRWLRQIGLWAAAGMLNGATAGACVRAIEVWLKTHESKLTRQVVDELRARLAELEQQTRERPRLGRVP
jgi:hypothetical protein